MDVYYKKHRRLSGYRVCDEIIKFFKSLDEEFHSDKFSLSEDQMHQLKFWWGDDTGIYGDHGLPFHAYEWKREKSKGNWLRITFPIWIIFIALMTLIVRPLKWLVTGSWWFGEKSKLEDFIGRWTTNIFGE